MQIEIEWSEGVLHRTTIGINRANVEAAGLDPDSDGDMLVYVREHMDPVAFADQAPKDYGDAHTTPPVFHRIIEIDPLERESDVA